MILAIQKEEAKILTELVPDRPIVIAGVDFDCVSSNEWPTEPVAFCVGSDNPMNQSRSARLSEVCLAGDSERGAGRTTRSGGQTRPCGAGRDPGS